METPGSREGDGPGTVRAKHVFQPWAPREVREGPSAKEAAGDWVGSGGGGDREGGLSPQSCSPAAGGLAGRSVQDPGRRAADADRQGKLPKPGPGLATPQNVLGASGFQNRQLRPAAHGNLGRAPEPAEAHPGPGRRARRQAPARPESASSADSPRAALP